MNVRASVVLTCIGAGIGSILILRRLLRKKKDVTSEEKAEEAKFENMFEFSDEKIRETFERIFNREMNLGEKLMENDETTEEGAVHLSNAIALSGEANKLLKVLQTTLPPHKFSTLVKYMPTAEFRASHLLKDELVDETVDSIFPPY